MKKLIMILLVAGLMSGCVSMDYLEKNYVKKNYFEDYGLFNEQFVKAWEKFTSANSDAYMARYDILKYEREFRVEMSNLYSVKVKDLEKTSELFRWINLLIDGKITQAEFESLLGGKIALNEMKKLSKGEAK